MNRNMRTYFYAVLGGIGGLIGWQISGLLGLSFIINNLYLSEMVVGGLVGMSIGMFIGITEGLMTRNAIHAGRAGLTGAALGLIAGGIALPLSEALFQVVGAGMFGRALGWGVFGMLVGLAEGIVGQTQAWKGMLGGLIGGIFGGILFETVQGSLQNPPAGKAAGLVLLGASVGAFISLIVVLLSRAWLEVRSGKLKGTEFILDKFMAKGFPSIAIGSSPLKSEIVLPDPDIAPQHAMLTGDGMHFALKDMSICLI